MRAGANQFGPVERANREFDAPPIDPGDFGLTDDPAPDRCRGQVRDIDVRANRAEPGVKVWLDRVQRRVLHHQDHHRRG